MRPKSLLTLLLFVASALLLAASGDPPPTPASPDTFAELSAALTGRLQAPPEAQSPFLSLFTPELDAAFTSPAGDTAVLWLALREDTGRRLAVEPGLALAVLSDQGWRVLLPGDPGWEETLAALPDGMLPLEHSPAPDGFAQDPGAVEALTGYYLPWAAGTSRWLEGSISHFQSIPELGYPSCAQEFCQYAYDFTDEWHFPLLASKAGTVFASRDTCSDGNTGCTNYIVLRTTGEQAYQIYLHLAHGTIPDKLTAGRAVQRGEYLGDTDDTGYSTSQHVHFMVTTDVWTGGDGYYWGRSVNVRFADVSINNGLPRTCYEVTHFPIYDGASTCIGNRSDPRNPANDWYVSGNVGAYPPTGTLTTPAPGEIVTVGNNPLMDVTATVSDDVGVTAVRLVAKLDGQWVEIGPKITNPAQPGLYDWDVDLCAVGGLNGPLEVAVRAWDHEGSAALALSPRTIQVDHACPPPSSQLKPAEGFNSTAVRLNWDAASAGAGFGSFELQWRTQPGSWSAANTLVIPGSQRSAWFAGQPAATYAFRMRALDANGQAEAWPAGDAAETSAVLPAACTPDGFEPDDAPAQARTLALGDTAQGNLCAAGDPDWFRVEIGKEGNYRVSGLSQSGGAAVSISVYAADGATLLASGSAPGVGQDVQVVFRNASAGVVTFKVVPLVENLIGTDAVYRVSVSEYNEVFLPLIAR